MQPATIPENFLPISIQLAQAAPIVMSFQNAANARARMNSSALLANTARKKHMAQTLWPITPNKRRPHLRLPVLLMKESDSNPPARHATEPNNNGAPAIRLNVHH